jgi:hypothetical protein
MEVEEIDAEQCESAAASLEGKILASFTKIIMYLSYEKQLMCIFFFFFALLCSSWNVFIKKLCNSSFFF